MTLFDPMPRRDFLYPSARSRLSLRHLRRSPACRGTAGTIVPFRAEVEQWRDVHLLRLRGELESGGVNLLLEVLACEHHIAVRRGAELRLDLSQVTFMDPDAYSALLLAREASETVGQPFMIDDLGNADLSLLEPEYWAGRRDAQLVST